MKRIVGQMFFHHLPPWERHRRVHNAMIALATGLFFGSAVGYVIFWANMHKL